MKLTFMFFITILGLSASIQTPTSMRLEGTGLMLSGTRTCGSARVFEDVTCGCFLAFANGVDSRGLRTKCRSVLSIAVRDSQSFCDRYLAPNNTFRTNRVIGRLQRIKDECILPDPDAVVHNAVVRPLTRPEIIARLDGILALAQHLCVVLPKIPTH